MWKMIREEEASQQSHPIFHRRSGDMSTSPLVLEKYKISKMYYVRMYQILFPCVMCSHPSCQKKQIQKMYARNHEYAGFLQNNFGNNNPIVIQQKIKIIVIIAVTNASKPA